MKVVSVKDLENVMTDIRKAEAEEYYASAVVNTGTEWLIHADAAAVYQAIREKLEKIPVFEV